MCGVTNAVQFSGMLRCMSCRTNNNSSIVCPVRLDFSKVVGLRESPFLFMQYFVVQAPHFVLRRVKTFWLRSFG
mgnify:CR=1 FL=1